MSPYALPNIRTIQTEKQQQKAKYAEDDHNASIPTQVKKKKEKAQWTAV